MSSIKRKRGPGKKAANKRGRKKEDSDVDSDLSDASDVDNSTQPDEILIAGHGDVLDEPTKLPEQLLKTLIRPAGQLLICGMVNWDAVGRKDNKAGGKHIPNLCTPHRFTDLRVRLLLLYIGLVFISCNFKCHVKLF